MQPDSRICGDGRGAKSLLAQRLEANSVNKSSQNPLCGIPAVFVRGARSCYSCCRAYMFAFGRTGLAGLGLRISCFNALAFTRIVPVIIVRTPSRVIQVTASL